MITTSAEFNTLAINGAKWYAKADNIADEMENIRYSDVVNPYDVFTIGNTASAILEFDIINPTQNYDNLAFKAQQGIKTSEGMEYIDLGVFKVLNAILDGNKLSVKAVDKMTYLMSDKYVPNVSLPTTDIAILNDIATQTGITVDTSNLVSHNITYLTNAYSKREIIGYIAALQGKNAYFNTQGNLIFKFYDTVDYTVDDDRIYFDSPTNVNSEKDFQCQYIDCTVYASGTQTELRSGNGSMGISINNPFMTQTILDEVLAKINTLTFRPMEIEFLGDFRLQCGDVITVNTGGNTYTVPIMQITHSSDGGVITNVVSIAQTESENAIEVEGELTQKFNKMLFDLVETKQITDGNTQMLVEQGTQIQAVQGAITSKVWQEDIEQSKSTNTAQGSPILITDTADGSLIELMLQGSVGDKGYFDGELLSGYYYNSTTPVSSSNAVCTKNIIPCTDNDVINVEYQGTTSLIRIVFFDSNKNFVARRDFNTSIATVTAPANSKYFHVGIADTNIQNAKHICIKINDMYAVKIKTIGKNQLDTSAKPQTSNGIDFSVDSNNGVSAIGTATADAYLTFDTELPLGEYIITGGTPSIQVICRKQNKNDGSYIWETCIGQPIRFSITEDYLDNQLIYVKVPAGAKVNQTIYPMIRYAEVVDDTYKPYEESIGYIPISQPLGENDSIENINGTYVVKRETSVETLLNQEVFYNISTFNPVTLISATDNPIMEVTYYRNSVDGQSLANASAMNNTQYSELVQDVDGFKTTASKTYATQTSVETVSTQATQTATQVGWLVKSGTSATDFTLTDRTADLVAEQINLKGLVTFSGLDESVKAELIDKVDVQYASSTSATTAPTSGWTTTAPVWEDGKYIWQRTVTTYTNGTTSTSQPTNITGAKGKDGTSVTILGSYDTESELNNAHPTGNKGDAYMVSGYLYVWNGSSWENVGQIKGDKGDTGNTGVGVSAIVEQYYLSNSNTAQSGGSWSATQPTWVSGRYIWTRSVITWTNGTTTYTTPILAQAINSANSTADTANNTANTANTKATNAVSTANSANTTANTANATANTANNNASTAITTANNADSNANKAIDTANTANQTASNANTNANKAVTTANSASTKADTAISTANSAKTTADSVDSVLSDWKIIEDNKTVINGSKIYTGSVTADKLNVNSIEAISANLGTITAGKLQSTDYVTDKAGMQIDLDNQSVISIGEEFSAEKGSGFEYEPQITPSASIGMMGLLTFNNMSSFARITPKTVMQDGQIDFNGTVYKSDGVYGDGERKLAYAGNGIYTEKINTDGINCNGVAYVDSIVTNNVTTPNGASLYDLTQAVQGKFVLNNGLKIFWGTVSSSQYSNDSDYVRSIDVTFPSAFTSTPYVLVDKYATSNSIIEVSSNCCSSSATTTGFTAIWHNINGGYNTYTDTLTATWLAIGY